MRTSVASIRYNRSLQSEPKEGTKLRNLYDQFKDGSPVFIGSTRSHPLNHKRLKHLKEEYDLNIIRIAPQTYVLQ